MKAAAVTSAVIATALHLSVIGWLLWTPQADTGAAQADGELGLQSGHGQLGSYTNTQQRIQAAMAPPAPAPEVTPAPAAAAVTLSNVAEPAARTYRQPAPATRTPEIRTQPDQEEVATRQAPLTTEPQQEKPQEHPQEVVKTTQERAQEETAAETRQEASTSTRRASGNAGQEANGGRRGNAADYIQTLNQWLARHRTYPAAAKRSKQEGTVKLAFTMNRQGEILSSHIAGSSGYPLLDDAALNMLQDAAPLPVVPEDFYPSRNTLPLVMPIEFSLITNHSFGD